MHVHDLVKYYLKEDIRPTLQWSLYPELNVIRYIYV